MQNLFEIISFLSGQGNFKSEDTGTEGNRFPGVIKELAEFSIIEDILFFMFIRGIKD